MNVFNRVIVVLTMLAIILCSALSIAGLAFQQGELVDIFRQVAVAYPVGTNLEVEVVVLGIIIAALAAIASVLVLWFEVVPGGSDGVRLKQVSGSNAVITVDAISQQVRHDAEQITNVRSARPWVRSSGKDVRVKIDLRLAPGTEVPNLIEQVATSVREGVQSKLGVQLKRLDIAVRHDKYDKKPIPIAKPATRDSLI